MHISRSFQHYMQALYQNFTAFDAQQTDRIQRYRNVEPESALFLAMQIHIQQSKEILEIGTSTGYSTLWLAHAAQQTQGRVTTLEIDPARTAQAQHHAQELGLDDVIDFWVGDAQKYLAKVTQQYDFIFLDAERDAYVGYWAFLQKMLNPCGGVLIVDNVISHAAQVKCFIELIENDPRFISMTLPIGAGLYMVCSQSF
ncbi:O-methyltransferase [Acinetobacter harbinensis]|uniref:O-methyltransferase n=1 Tax=Acinetobacter harbinensis TaxID=1353941 RepID=UPI0028E92AFB|nr:O-methyltransferase [Acinetobacter harbinensis]